MTFVAPWALLGLVAAGIPLLLHLVRRQPPPEQSFPAMRYLSEATRDHRRRLRLEDLLLLITRTVLIAAVVLAAAGPVLSFAVPFGRHAPTALVVILDDSPSSTVMIDGEPLVDRLRQATLEVLAQATPSDRIWLIPSDGFPRPGTSSQLAELLPQLTGSPGYFELGPAVDLADRLVTESGLPGQVVVISDMQATAVTAAEPKAPLLVLRPDGAPPANRHLPLLDPGAQPWGREGGTLLIGIAAADSTPVPVSLRIDGSEGREVLAKSGTPAARRITAPAAGWRHIRVELPPDELRWDDVRDLPLRVVELTAAAWDASDRFLAAAMDVLAQERRVMRGEGARAVSVGTLGPGASLVMPPEDPALLAALNRELSRRGSAWLYGDVTVGEAVTDSGATVPGGVAVRRRVELLLTGTVGDTLATAGGEPWLVRSGNIVLLGSRLDPLWTDLPVRAQFVPLLDALVTRSVSGEDVVPVIAAGTMFSLPSRAGTVIGPGGSEAVEGGARWTPREVGIHWLLAGSDTIAGVSVIADPRESDLGRADDDVIASTWQGAVTADLGGSVGRLFAMAGRGDLRPLLLTLAAIALLTEAVIAGRRVRR